MKCQRVIIQPAELLGGGVKLAKLGSCKQPSEGGNIPPNPRSRCIKRLKRMRVIHVAIPTLSNYTSIRPSTTQNVCPVEGISKGNPLNK